MGGHREKTACTSQGERPQGNRPFSGIGLRRPASRILRKSMRVVEAPSLRCFVMVARAG